MSLAYKDIMGRGGVIPKSKKQSSCDYTVIEHIENV